MDVWSSLRLYPIWSYEGEVPSHARDVTTDHTPERGSFAWYLQRGNVQLTSASHGRVEVSRGNWVILSPGRWRQKFSSDARIVSVRFMATWPDGRPVVLFETPAALPGTLVPELLKSGRALAASVKRHLPAPEVYLIFAQSTTFAGFCDIQTRFHRWIGALARALAHVGHPVTTSGPRDERVARAVYAIEHQDLAAPLDRTALARSCGLSVSQLNRLFASELQLSPHQLFDLRRTRVAKVWLKTQTPIKMIAYRLGFDHPSYFTRWFTKMEGQTPRAFRASPAQ